MPAITILLPVYNADPTLTETLASIAAQTHADYELLAIDDGSTDESALILDRDASLDSRVRVYHRPHEGLVRSLNFGLERAESPWIARMDADDLMRPTRLEKQLAFAEADPAVGLVATQANYLGDEDSNEGMARFVEWNNRLVTHEQIVQDQFVESPLIHPTVMFRRGVVEEHGGYREGPFPEDYELWLRWLEAGVRMAKVAEPLLDWRERPGRLTRTSKRYCVDAFYRAKAPYLYQWLERNNPHHPEVWVWGAGRTSRHRLRWLTASGLRVVAYVDIDPDKIGQKIGSAPVYSPEELPAPGDIFLLTAVASRGARGLIEARLRERLYQPLRHYVCTA